MLTIRLAEPADLSRVQQCAREASSRKVSRREYSPVPQHVDVAAQIDSGRVHVAQWRDQFAGYMVLRLQSDHVLLENLVVLPALSDKGVDQQLIAHAEQLARECGMPRVVLYTHVLTHENLSLYYWLGYSRIGRHLEQGVEHVVLSRDVTVKLRRAESSDASIMQVWDEKPHIRKAVSNSGDVSFDADWAQEIADMDDTSEFLIAEVSGRPIGAMQLIDPAREPTHYWGDVEDGLRAIDIWIGEEDCLGKGYGTTMMTFAINRCFSCDAVSAIIIDPLTNNVAARRFYERLGFVFVERRQFDVHSDCAVYRLARDHWERSTLLRKNAEEFC